MSNTPHHADPLFTVRREPADKGEAHLSLAGELDISGVELLEAWIDHVCGKGYQKVTVDLSGLTFTDVAGACALAAARRRLAQHCSQVSMTGASGQVQRILDLYEKIRTRLPALKPLRSPWPLPAQPPTSKVTLVQPGSRRSNAS